MALKQPYFHQFQTNYMSIIKNYVYICNTLKYGETYPKYH